jgi:transposase
MPERQFELTEEQVAALWRAYDEGTEGDTKTRYQAVRLYGTDYPLPTILEVTGCTISGLRTWVRVYRTAGLEGLADHRVGGNSAKLTPDQRPEVEARLQPFTPQPILGPQAHSARGQFWTVEDVQEALRRW